MYSWLLVLVVLMAGAGQGGKRRRYSAQQPVEPPPEDVESEYVPGDESELDEEDWEVLTPEVLSKKKGTELAAPTGIWKEKAKDKGKGKGKKKGKEKEQEPELQTYTRGQRRSGGIKIRNPASGSPPRAPDVLIDPRRRSMYSSKHCIGERVVDVANLFMRVPGFQTLFENENLHAICDFPEQTGYCLELIREFYMRAGYLDDFDGGPFIFTTSVRGVELSITPDTIASVLKMAARTDGVEYLHAGFDAVRDWRRVLTDICVPGTESNGIAVLSKDLKLEYRFLNFVVCYNVMPLANTKVLRWDRILYMYLLGHPERVQAGNINLNVPFLIWRRMAKDIKTSSQKDRLPFPLLIMRILCLFDVDTRCTSYEHSLGAISETTMVKSSVQLRSQQPSSPRDVPLASVPARARPSVESDEDFSASSVYRELQRLSRVLELISADQARISADQARISADQAQIVTDVAKLNKKVGRMFRLLRALCEKMGCDSSDLPPPGDDSD